MSYEVTGKLVEKFDTQRVSDRFQKREFVIEFYDMINGAPSQYANYIKFQLVQQKVDIIDRFEVGSTIKVNFNLKGSRYEKEGRTNYFTSLDAWRIEQAQEGAPAGNNSGYNQQSNNGYNNNNNNNGGGNRGWGNSTQNPAPSVAFNGGGNYNPAPENADDLPF